MNNDLIYLDTNIYIDYFEDRSDGLRPLGDFAFNLIKKALDCEYKIVCSSVIEDELLNTGHKDELQQLLILLKAAHKVINVELAKEDNENVSRLSGGKNVADAKHAILAQKMKVQFFVTRNWKHFQDFSDVINLCHPENL